MTTLFIPSIFYQLISYVLNSSLEEVQMCFKEVAYSYYKRSGYIQYNASKYFYFPPEEATSQNINFETCIPFTASLYQELLNITIPTLYPKLLSMKKNIGKRPEVIAYGAIKDNNL